MITLGQDNTKGSLKSNRPALGDVSSSKGEANPYDQMDANAPQLPPVQSTLGQVGKQLVGSFTNAVPQMLGQATQAFTPTDSYINQKAKELSDYETKQLAATSPDLRGKGNIETALITGAQSIGPSVASLPFYAAGPVVGGLATTALFGGQQYTQEYERMKALGKSDEEAHQAGLLTGTIQGGGEALANKFSLRLLGAGKKALSAGVEGVIKGATDTSVIKPFAKAFGEAMVGENLTENAQNVGTEGVERAYGAGQQSIPDILKQTTLATSGMTVLLAPLGLVGHYKNAVHAGQIDQVLTDPNTPKATREAVVNNLHAEAVKLGIPEADQWKQLAQGDIAANQPIRRGLDASTANPEEATTKQIDPGKISSDAVDMTTGKPIVNKDIAKLINTYDALHATQPDTSNEDYLKQTNAIRNSLNEMTYTPEGKTPDHVKVQEAEAALKQIDSAHNLLSTIQERDKIKADSSKVSDVPEVTPAPVVDTTPEVTPTPEITPVPEVKAEEVIVTPEEKPVEAAPVVDQGQPAPEVNVEDSLTTLYHATPKEFDNLDVSKSTDFGIHLGDQATAQYIAETSNKNNIVSTKLDTSNFIETKDLDSWQTPDIIHEVQDKIDLTDPKKKAYWTAQVKKLTNAYGIATQSPDPKLRVAQVNHELAKTLSALGVDGLKYTNDKEGHGKESYILLKNPESIQKEGRVEKNREPDVFTPKVETIDANKIESTTTPNVSSGTQSSLREKGGNQTVSSKRVRTSRQAKGEVTFSKENQGLIDHLNNTITTLTSRLLTEKDHRVAGGEHIEDMTALASEVVQATALRDSIIAESAPKVVKEKKVKTTPVLKEVKEVSTSKNTIAEVIVSNDDTLEPSTKALSEVVEDEKAIPLDSKQQVAWDDLELELRYLRDTVKTVPKEEQALIRSRIADIKAQIADGSNTTSQAEMVPTTSEFSDSITTMSKEGDVVELYTGTDKFEDTSPILSLIEKRSLFNKIVNMFSSNTTLDLDIKMMDVFTQESLKQEGLSVSYDLSRTKGLHIAGNSTRKTRVFINASLVKTAEDLKGTFAHETLGHYGLRKVFSKSGEYENFLGNLLNNNKELRENILSLGNRWYSYLETWKKDNIPNYSDLLDLERNRGTSTRLERVDLVEKYWIKNYNEKSYQFKSVQKGIVTSERMPYEIGLRLADEYMAELAKQSFNSKAFMDKEVGMGIGIGSIEKRKYLTSQRQVWFTQFLTKIKHLLQKIFGDTFNHLTHADLTKLIAQSIDNTFSTINPDALFGSTKAFESPIDLKYEGIDSTTVIPTSINRGIVSFSYFEADTIRPDSKGEYFHGDSDTNKSVYGSGRGNIIKNPTRAFTYKMSQSDDYSQIRGVIDNETGNLYIAVADSNLHAWMLKALRLPADITGSRYGKVIFSTDSVYKYPFNVFSDDISNTISNKTIGTPVTQQNISDSDISAMFTGIGAKNVDLYSLDSAKQSIQKGLDKEQVRKNTGWFKDETDGKWKFEISDKDAVFNKHWAFYNDGDSIQLSKMITHDKLFAAYPIVGFTQIYINKGNNIDYYGAYDPSNNSIELNGDLDILEAMKNLMHEIQHVIQRREGFARGASPDTLWDDLDSNQKEKVIEEHPELLKGKDNAEIKRIINNLDISLDLYNRVAGEVEARNTEERIGMTETQRQQTPPSSTEEFTPSQKIVLFNGNTINSYIAFSREAQADLEMSDQLEEDQIANAFTPGRIEDTKVFVDGIMSGFGSQAENVRSKFWDKLNESINNSSILSSFKALGNLNTQEAYNAMGTIFKGEISQAEEYVKGFTASIKNLNSMQNQAVFEYFTNKDSDASLLPVTPLQRNNIIKAKESIRTIGKSLNNLGMIDDATYEKNEDAYLHVVYMKYIDQYKGSNKKTSMLSWMKKRENKTEREKLALGEIKDVKFLVPETLGTMARDQVLLQMFDTIGQMSRDNNLYWVMSRDIKIKYPGRRTKLTLEQAYEQLDQNKFILDMHDKNSTQEFGTTGKDTLIEELRKNTGILETNISAVNTAEARMLSEAYEAAKERGETKAEDQSKFLLEQYTRLPNKKQMGSLKNKWVRKEIANDLDAITGAYNLSDKNTIERFFARGGTLERINQLWKMSMVALNPGSWVRNIMGNFSLLDLSTNTNKLKLISMLHEEISGTISGEQSEYWKLATKYGLFGSTWSAIELQDLQKTYGSDLLDAKKRFEARGEGSSIDKQFHFLDERLMSIGKMLGRRVGASTSKAYSLAEGAFKTVSMRDYINTWEDQNKVEFPEGYKSLPENMAQILLSKAANHANDAIFDYSQVNSMVKTLRRIPFGSPFITFTYKAGPAAIRAMVNHPMKFAQYATLPALLTLVAQAFNDWDNKDIDKFKSSLTDYQRLNPGVAFLPFKDAKGRPQILPLDYMIPWSQYSTAARKVYDNFIQDGGESPVSTSVKSVGTALNEFGFLGGPTPTGIAAMLSGKDDFTGRDITTPGASASQQIGEAMTYAYNMVTPAWLSSHGWFAKMYDAFKDKPTTDRFGNIKYTPAQAASDITGFRPTSVNVNAGLQNRKMGFEVRLKEVASLRTKVIMDRNETNKIGKLKDINMREKIIRSQMMEALK